MKIYYQSQYRDPYSYAKNWLKAGFPMTEDEAKIAVMQNQEKYLGHNYTHRLVKITESVVDIISTIELKEKK